MVLKFLFNPLLLMLIVAHVGPLNSQNQMVTYAGNSGAESFNDVLQLSNGHFLVIGSADNLTWLPPAVPQIAFSNPGITNSGGSKTAFILEFDQALQNVLAVYHLNSGVAEDFRFLKNSGIPGQPTGDLYLSGNTSTGYFIGKLNDNFVNGIPTGFSWVENVPATTNGYPKIYQPWDVGSDGKVIYATGDSHDYNWSAIYRLKSDGSDDVVPNWRVHWKSGGGEHYGAASQYAGGVPGLLYSAIVFKRDNRCELRSTNLADYNLWQPDGNGGTKKGKWPLDVLYNSPCVPGGAGNTTAGPGYTGYGPAGTFTYGPSSIAIDRRSNKMYIGFNAKSVLPSGEPDFEPAVMAMDTTGELLWWSRLYHEKDAAGNLFNSEPDQYIDALAIDYSQPEENGDLVVGARCHGNNTQNFWKGNLIPANPAASGFQNNFTGSNGNIHISYLAKIELSDGTLHNSTFMAEYSDITSNLGAAHPDANLDGWANPNSGWPNVNTTYIRKNSLKVTSDGSVVVLGTGRRTITTANAWQKMVKQTEGSSSWNEFVRVYNPALSKPLYSSLVVGQWDLSSGAGGNNVNLFGAYKTAEGVIAVGMHNGSGGEIPIVNVPSWGSADFNGSSAVLVHYKASNLFNAEDGPNSLEVSSPIKNSLNISIAPNPTSGFVNINCEDCVIRSVRVYSAEGKLLNSTFNKHSTAEIYLDAGAYSNGLYIVNIEMESGIVVTKKLLRN